MRAISSELSGITFPDVKTEKKSWFKRLFTSRINKVEEKTLTKEELDGLMKGAFSTEYRFFFRQGDFF